MTFWGVKINYHGQEYPAVKGQMATMIFPLLCVGSLLVFYTPIVDGYEPPKFLYLGILATGGLVYILQRNEDVKLPAILPLSLFFLGSALSGINALNYYEFGLTMATDLMGISLFWITVNLVKGESMDRVLWMMAGIGTIVALAFLLLPGSQGTIGNSVLVGILLVPFVPIAGLLAPWGLAPASIILLAIWMSNSHAALLAIVALGCVLIWKHAPMFGKSLAMIPAIGLSLFILKVAPGANLATQYRLDWWRNSAHMVADHPVFGVGRGNFVVVYPQYAILGDQVMGGLDHVNRAGQRVDTAINSPHNDFLQIWTETGPLGIGGLLWFLWIVLIGRKWNETGRAGKALALSLVGILVTATFHFPLHAVAGGMVFWVICGLLWVASEKDIDTEPVTVPGSVPSCEPDAVSG